MVENEPGPCSGDDVIAQLMGETGWTDFASTDGILESGLNSSQHHCRVHHRDDDETGGSLKRGASPETAHPDRRCGRSPTRTRHDQSSRQRTAVAWPNHGLERRYSKRRFSLAHAPTSPPKSPRLGRPLPQPRDVARAVQYRIRCQPRPGRERLPVIAPPRVLPGQRADCPLRHKSLPNGHNHLSWAADQWNLWGYP